MVNNTNSIQTFYISVHDRNFMGVVDHFIGKKRVDNTRFITNLTIQAVWISLQFNEPTLDSGINIGLRLLFFEKI